MALPELIDSYHTLVLELRNAINVVGIFVTDLEKLEKQIEALGPAPVADPRWLEYPLDYRPVVVTGEFGVTNSFYTWTHEGIDISVPVGRPVYSCADGKVVFVGVKAGYGNCIRVQHERDGKKRWTWYAHLSAMSVMVWSRIKAGDTIGLTGNSGNTTGPHLHLNVQLEENDFQPPAWSVNLRGCDDPRKWVKGLDGATVSLAQERGGWYAPR